MGFMTQLNNELNNEKKLTENGAVGYRTTGKKLLDLNFAVASLRKASEDHIINKFMDTYWENPMLAVKWLFYARDAREGLGERRLFRTVMKHLAADKPEVVRNVIGITAEYGRWDDLWCLLETELVDDVVAVVQEQLTKDFTNMMDGKSVSLLAKWMPSANASSAITKKYASILCKKMGDTPRGYRKVLSRMRQYIDIVERKMSSKEWNAINYEAVPSRANLIYNGAFLRNDEARRREYLAALEKGDAKINAGTLYPHDIVHKYMNSRSLWGNAIKSLDSTLEGLWKALPNTVKDCGNTIVVADGSGSMNCNVGDSSVTALEVANALAIYFAERSSGEFKDKYITFSNRPQLVDLSNAKTLHDKVGIALRHNEVASTNVEATFDLILKTAVNNHMEQRDMPQNVLIISDMEFNNAVCGNPNDTLFNTIAKKYAAYGYKLPRLVFWNVNSRTGAIPVKQNELGVALVSGFSVNIVNMVMSNKLDPYECLLDVLNTERYRPIEDAVRGVC